MTRELVIALWTGVVICMVIALLAFWKGGGY